MITTKLCVMGEGAQLGAFRVIKKKPQLQSLCEFSDSKIFRLDFSVKAVEITLNASLPHAVGIPGTSGSMRTTQGPQPHSLVTYPPRHDGYVTRDIGLWVWVGLR